MLCQVRLRYVSLSQVRLGQVRLGQVKLGQVMLGQFRSCYVRLGQVTLASVRLGQVRLVQVRLCQVSLGRVMLGQVRLRQLRLCQVTIILNVPAVFNIRVKIFTCDWKILPLNRWSSCIAGVNKGVRTCGCNQGLYAIILWRRQLKCDCTR